MDPQFYDLLKQCLPVIGTLLGAALGILGSIIINRMNQKAELRKHISSLAFNAGIENWKGSIDFAKYAASKGRGVAIATLEANILNAAYISKFLFENDLNNLDEIHLRKFFEDKDKLLDVVHAVAEKKPADKS